MPSEQGALTLEFSGGRFLPVRWNDGLGFNFGEEIEMTRDEIIRMMRSVCDKDKVDAWQCDFWTITQEELERFAALVAAAEREEGVKAVLAQGEPTYCTGQHTKCAVCLEDKHTPLRIDSMGGYVCLTCIDRKLTGLLQVERPA
jgi:hypothetical protein